MSESLNYDEFRIRNKMPPLPEKPKYKKQHNVHVSDETWERLQVLAESMGYAYWQGGSISMLLEAIGQNLIKIVPANQELN